MNAERLGRLARRLRVRQRLTQTALAIRAGVSRQAVSLLELGHRHRLQIGTVEAIIGALGGRLDVRIFWNGPELDQLLDAAHAALGAAVKQRLERWGWVVRVEVSYSHYGERGRIDLLAWHPRTRVLLVLEDGGLPPMRRSLSVDSGPDPWMCQTNRRQRVIVQVRCVRVGQCPRRTQPSDSEPGNPRIPSATPLLGILRPIPHARRLDR